MTDHARTMLAAETAFLSGVEANFEAAKGRILQGSVWRTARHDADDQVRAAMARQRVYDRERLKGLPKNRRIALHGYRRTWWLGRRPTGVAVASVLCPVDAVVRNRQDELPPIDLPELMDHVRRIATDSNVPHVIGVCAPSGFTKAALEAAVDLPNVTLVLVEPSTGGGWQATCSDENVPKHVLNMFDPETTTDKVERIRQELDDRSADLLTAGLSASTLARDLALPKALVESTVNEIVRSSSELRVSRSSEDLLIYRGAAERTAERNSMNVVDRIRLLFARDGDEVEKINVLSERRAKLAQRRDSLYEDIGKLENKEANLVKQGKESSSKIVQRRLAAQVLQCRKDIARQNTTANMLSQQIDIISTDIHNLTLIQQGNMAKLPSAEDLTENAVQAEEMLETLKVDADLVSSLETGLADIATSDEEIAILKEFEGEDDKPASTPPVDTPPVEDVEVVEADNESSTTPPETPGRRAEPEAS